MKLAVFGASGRTGRPLVEQALARGHEVRALVRDPAKLPLQHERLVLVRGDAMNAADVASTVAGTDAVLSVLGQTKGSPKDLQTVATRHMVAAMKAHGAGRIISLTGAGVRDPQDKPKPVDRVFGLLLAVAARDVLRDANAHAEVLRGSGLDYTLVRGPRLTEGPRTGVYRVGYVGKDSGTQASRADVADFMLRQLDDDSWVRRAPVVSY